jgi:hypothetical protein
MAGTAPDTKITCKVLDLFMTMGYSGVYENRKNRQKERFAHTMAYNVPAVYDVLPARIRALRSKDQGWQNVV